MLQFPKLCFVSALRAVDAHTADLFDTLMRGFFNETLRPPYYIHLGTGLFKTDGGLITDADDNDYELRT